MTHILFPVTSHKYLQLLAIQRLQAGMRLNLSDRASVIREADRYVVYYNWMSAISLVEVFSLEEAGNIIGWLEQRGYYDTRLDDRFNTPLKMQNTVPLGI